MTDDTQEALEIDSKFDFDILDSVEVNRRITVRYVREDIKASLSNLTIFLFCELLHIQLLDLSTKGALILSDKKIRKNKKITVFLEFEDGRTFEIKAIIVRQDTSKSNVYGIKFDKYNDALGEYLLQTQTKLIFK